MDSFAYLPQLKTTTLNVGGGIDSTQTTGIVLQSVSGVDITKPGILAVSWSDPINTSAIEYITYTSINGSNELQGVTRGEEGISAKAHSNGATIAFPVSKMHINLLNDMLETGGIGYKQIATPSSPIAGRNKLYFKNDNKVYKLTSAGVESEVGASSFPKKLWIPARNFGIQSGSASYDTNTSDTIQHWSLDAAANEGIQTDAFKIPTEWGSGTITLKLHWAMASATSGSVKFQMQYKNPTADGETMAGVNAWDEQTVAVPGTAKLLKITTSVASAIAVSADDLVVFRVIRLGSDGGDTAAGDMWVFGLEVIFS